MHVRLLGELQVARAGRVLPLPASKKTRALLGYLVATGQPHLRERLCDLLWEGPGDPRAELRWSLTKLRPLLNDDRAVRLHATREHVGFQAHGAEVDLVRVRGLLSSGPRHATLDALRSALDPLEGALLDGLDLPACPRYQEWCVAERESLSALRSGVLATLVRRLENNPEEALGYARRWVAADPLSEPAHAAVVRMLTVLGRNRDALSQYQYSRQLLEAELPALSGELDAARRPLRSVQTSAERLPPPARAPAGQPAARPLVGRHAERALIAAHIERARLGRGRQLTLLLGEPGIGKSRLLRDAAEQVAAAGGRALTARAFEAEIARPYGIWADAMRGLEGQPFPGKARDRPQLFEAVAQRLNDMAEQHGPLALVFDDLQWADDASCSLLHYVMREPELGAKLAVFAAARPDELEDNAAGRNLLESLRRDRRVQEVRMAPLSAEETAQLVSGLVPEGHAGSVCAESDGHPLFALLLAQARAAGIDWVEHSLGSLIQAQLARLDPRHRDVLAYAAALGRAFPPELLAPAAGFDAPALLAALGELERRGFLRPAGEEQLDFAHDLIRQGSYRGLSQPRRRLLHAQISRGLALAAERDESLYAELARHASAAGEHQLAAHACAMAGAHCLRALGNIEAATLADMGLRELARLPRSPERARLHMQLLEIRLLARTGADARRSPGMVDEVAQAVGEAERLQLHEVAATGYHLLAICYQGAGELERAQQNTLRSAYQGAVANDASRARHLARTARCLLDLERDVPRARALLHESAAAARCGRLEVHELAFGEGLLQRWDGQMDRAAASLERALAMSRAAEDRWTEFRCLTYLMMLELERGQFERMERLAATLLQLGREMGEADVPFARVLRAVCAPTRRPDDRYAELEQALDALRQASDKSMLAYALNQAAIRALAQGHASAARRFAQEALAAAQSMNRSSETLIARVLVARAAADCGEAAAVSELTAGLAGSLAASPGLSARARAAWEALAATRGAAVPTLAPTRPL